jgi:hypothetical protein
VPPEVVEKLKPERGPTVILTFERFVPDIVKEFGPAEVLIQTFPNAVREVEESNGVGGGSIVNDMVFDEDAAPVVVTPTKAVPGAEISEAVISAVSWVAETKVVVRELPFHVTVDCPEI